MVLVGGLIFRGAQGFLSPFAAADRLRPWRTFPVAGLAENSVGQLLLGSKPEHLNDWLQLLGVPVSEVKAAGQPPMVQCLGARQGVGTTGLQAGDAVPVLRCADPGVARC